MPPALSFSYYLLLALLFSDGIYFCAYALYICLYVVTNNGVKRMAPSLRWYAACCSIRGTTFSPHGMCLCAVNCACAQLSVAALRYVLFLDAMAVLPHMLFAQALAPPPSFFRHLALGSDVDIAYLAH